MGTRPLIVSCTRGRRETTPLFQSIVGLGLPVDLWFFDDNRAGLSARYNQALAAEGARDLVVFAHDDLRLIDPMIIDKATATDGDVLGIVGSDKFTIDPNVPLMSWVLSERAHQSGYLVQRGK